jgi:hypothetical protein
MPTVQKIRDFAELEVNSNSINGSRMNTLSMIIL